MFQITLFRSRLNRILTGLAVVATGFAAVNSPAAAVRTVWRSTGTSSLPAEQIGTAQWLDVILDVDAAGLVEYRVNLTLDLGVLQLIGGVVETPPAPLQATIGGAFVTGPVIQNIQAQAAEDDVFAGPASVVVASVELMVTGESQSAVQPDAVQFVDGDFSSPTIGANGAVIGEPPPVLGIQEYTFQLVASSEDAAYDSFLPGGTLGENGRIAFLSGTLGDPDAPQKIVVFENNTLTAIADNGIQFNNFETPRINASGRVTFWAADGGKSADTTIKFDQGLYEYDGNLNEFLSVNPAFIPVQGLQALGQSPFINDSNEVVFSASYRDLHEEPATTWNLGFDTIQWQDISDPNSDPVELYRGRDPEDFLNRPAIYNGIDGPSGFNNSGQVLFYAYTDGVFPDGRGELLLGGVQDGLPVEPVLIASETTGTYDDIRFSQLNEDGSVVFDALLPGDFDYSIFCWKDGSVETILATDNPFDIRYQDSLTFVSRNNHVVFAGQNGDSLGALFMWTPTGGTHQILVMGQGPFPGDVLQDTNGQPIRPPTVNSGFLQNLMGVDDLGRVALNIQWEDGVETILFATPVTPPSNMLNVGAIKFNGGQFQMTFEGETGASLNLEGTTNFVNWTVITNFTTGEEPVPVNDPNAGESPLKFYRVVPEN